MKQFFDAALVRRRAIISAVFLSCLGLWEESFSQSMVNNTKPTIHNISNQVAKSNGDGHFIRLTGITPGLEDDQGVTLAIETNKDLFDKMEISESTNGCAFIQYQPKKGISGIATITVTAVDNSIPPRSVRRSFNIIIAGVGKAALPGVTYPPAVQTDISLTALPNPVRTTSRIHFSTDKAEHASVDVYSLSGHKIINLFRGNTQSLRNYNLTFSRERLASGTYVVKLTTKTNQQVLRLILQ